jgi:CRISPR/Cas system-associated protein endoribonuclease Cas2
MDVRKVLSVSSAVVEIDKAEVNKMIDALAAYNANNGNTDSAMVVLEQQFRALKPTMP